MWIFRSNGIQEFKHVNVFTKNDLPISDYTVIAATPSNVSTYQITSISGKWKPGNGSLLLIIPIIDPQDVELIDSTHFAKQFDSDMKGCFPTLIRKSFHDIKSESSSDSESETNSKTSQTSTIKHDKSIEESHPISDHIIHIFDSVDELFEVYTFAAEETKSLIDEIQLQYDSSHSLLSCRSARSIGLVCLELKASGDKKAEINSFYHLYRHPRSSPTHLDIPIPKNQLVSLRDMSTDSQILVDASVYTVNTQRLESHAGGGKTSDEMIKNIRLRHASGTFCTLKDPEWSFSDVLYKFKHSEHAILKNVHGPLRLRKLIGKIPNQPVQIRLND